METEMTIPAKDWNSEKGKMEDTSLPEWQKYYAELERHEKFCDDYRFFLDRICRHLEWLNQRGREGTWTTEDIQKVIASEIDKSRSMDAPNKPGYTRANND